MHNLRIPTYPTYKSEYTLTTAIAAAGRAAAARPIEAATVRRPASRRRDEDMLFVCYVFPCGCGSLIGYCAGMHGGVYRRWGEQ